MKQIVKAVFVGRRPDDPGVPGYADGFGIMAPRSAKIVRVGLIPPNIAAYVLGPAGGGIDVWHPLIVVPDGQPFDLNVGVSCGEHLGVVGMPVPGGQGMAAFHVFKALGGHVANSAGLIGRA